MPFLETVATIVCCIGVYKFYERSWSPKSDKKDRRKQIAFRTSELTETHDGREVWFSFGLKAGRLLFDRSHWTMFIGDQKYEIRQQDNGSKMYQTGGFDTAKLKRDLLASEWGKYRYRDKFFPMMIGWTLCTDDEINDFATTLADEYRYHWRKSNCQDFLKLLSDRIILNTNRAVDWGHFRRGVVNDYYNGYTTYDTMQVGLEPSHARAQRRLDYQKLPPGYETW